jgi:hypothetical protein
MTGNEIREELAIIKSMIEKARNETAESGHFFIWIGIFSIVAVFVINRLETWGKSTLVLPAFFVMLVVCGAIGYFTVSRNMKKAGARSYPNKICYSVWFACGVPAVIVTFVFPLLEVYPWNLVPILSSLLMGIAVFSSGIIFESAAIVWCALAWWGGSIAMVFIEGFNRMFVMMAIIALGWILPGIILNRRFRSRRDDDES